LQGAFRSPSGAIGANVQGDPIAADGEFAVDDTDLVLPGFGVPFVFERHYRSGVDFKSPLGYGWNHSFGRRLIDVDAIYSPNCEGPKSDIIYLDERMNRLRFRYESTSADGVTDYFAPTTPGPKLQLSRNNLAPRTAWTLVEPSGTRYRFDRQYGTLS